MRILLVRTSAMGDIVHTLPVLMALRRHFPAAEIAWVVEAVWSRMLDGHPDIDRLIRVRTKAWRKTRSLPEMRAAVREMRDFGADVAIDLMGNWKGAALARLSGAKRILGADSAHRREGSSAFLVPETTSAEGIHAVDRALSLLAPLSIIPGPVDFGGHSLLRSPSTETEQLIEHLLGGAEKPVVLFQLGAGWANKQWPLPWWAEIAKALDARGYDVWLPSAPGEEALAEEVAALSGGLARIVDATDFHLFAALCRHAKLLIGGDTGPLHLAHALGTPVLCLIGPTEPSRNGPYPYPTRNGGAGRGGGRDRLGGDHVLFHRLPCSGCYKRFDGPRACLLSILPSAVLERAVALLETSFIDQPNGI